MTPPVKRMRGWKVPVISLVDCKRQRSTLIVSQPPTAKLFNNPFLSDVKLKVGASCFYGHKLVLSAASDVFAKMFEPGWVDASLPEIELREDAEAERIFDKFLKYLYCGKIMVPRDVLFTLYLLADKYNVESLINECVTNLEKGLTVRSEMKEISRDERIETHDPSCMRECCRLPSVVREFDLEMQPSTSSNSSEPPDVTVVVKTMVKTLVPNVTFPISTVIKILNIVNNARIYDAALYNLETRLADQILNENYRVWNSLQADMLLKVLADNHFYCIEYIIFKAVKMWLSANEEINDDLVRKILSKIRFGVMNASELYDVESDLYLVKYPDTISTVREAIRYKLFRDCPRAMEKENWSGEQFTPRTPKTEPNKAVEKPKDGSGKRE